MPAPPLTHHDIIRIASPLKNRGFIIDMARSSRADRYIEFQTQSSFSPLIRCVHTLHVGTSDKHHVSRVLLHANGLVSSLEAVASRLDEALDTFEKIPHERQMRIHARHTVAFSYALKPLPAGESTARLELQFTCADVAGLELRTDTSTGGSMPADLRVVIRGVQAPYLPDTLASGANLPMRHRAARRHLTAENYSTDSTAHHITSADSATKRSFVTDLPEDFLAVLGSQWRPLRFQGDHWKGVLRTLGKEPARTPCAEQHVMDAVEHVAQSLADAPAKYHERLHKARWRVFVRRLQPLMLFVGILAMMPLSWLFVSQGDRVLHPLALGLTPLLMVGVVVLTAREIPVMEIPSLPKPVPENYWSSDQQNAESD